MLIKCVDSSESDRNTFYDFFVRNWYFIVNSRLTAAKEHWMFVTMQFGLYTLHFAKLLKY